MLVIALDVMCVKDTRAVRVSTFAISEVILTSTN